jgi:hypothetical protein
VWESDHTIAVVQGLSAQWACRSGCSADRPAHQPANRLTSGLPRVVERGYQSGSRSRFMVNSMFVNRRGVPTPIGELSY